MNCKCNKHGIIMLVAGLILILNQVFFMWDIWIVIGAMAIIKGVIVMLMPGHECCNADDAAKKPARRR